MSLPGPHEPLPTGATLVVGYEGSPSARAALSYAAARAGPQGTVVAVYGYAPPPDWLGEPNYQRVPESHQSRGRAVLEAILTPAGDVLPETNLETDLSGSRRAEAILAAAQTRRADEIVVGSRGLGRIRAALGSVAHDILHSADRPVVVIQHPREPHAA